MVVRFLLGEVPRDFLRANLGSRLIALRKPNGKVRPIACGSVLRRLAARAACAAFRDQVKAACGPHQYAVGRQAGCEHVHKSITALSAADPRCVFLAFDASNAFNTLPRGAVVDAVGKRLPDLAVVVNNWLGQPTGHTYWQADGGKGVVVEATAGVDQGCPLSPALFAMGIADTLDTINARLSTLSSAARVFSYLDDVVVAIPSEHAATAAVICVEELQRAGLVIKSPKTTVWTKDPSTPLPDSIANQRVAHMKCLGATAPWLHNDDPLSQLPVHESADGDAAVVEAAGFETVLPSFGQAGFAIRLLSNCCRPTRQVASRICFAPTTSRVRGWSDWTKSGLALLGIWRATFSTQLARSSYSSASLKVAWASLRRSKLLR